MKQYTEDEIKLKILNEPDAQIEFLNNPDCEERYYKLTLLEDQIRVDFGFDFAFSINFEKEDPLYLKLSDYGKTWKFIDYTYVLNQEYELFKMDERYQYIKGNVLYSKAIFVGITPDTPHGKVLRKAEDLKDICDAYYIDDGELPLKKDNFFGKKDYKIFITTLRYNDKHGLCGGFSSGRGIVRTNNGLKFIGRVNKFGNLK